MQEETKITLQERTAALSMQECDLPTELHRDNLAFQTLMSRYRCAMM